MQYDFSDSEASDDEVELYWDKLMGEKRDNSQGILRKKRKFEEI